MDWCVHFDLPRSEVRCTICVHGLPDPKAPRRDDFFFGADRGHFEVDPGDVLMVNILEGAICPSCFTARKGLGCVCHRNKLGTSDLDESCTWLETAVEVLDLTPRETAHLATSVTKRILRRMTLTEDEREDITTGVREQFSVEPKWTPFRRTEPTHLPV